MKSKEEGVFAVVLILITIICVYIAFKREQPKIDSEFNRKYISMNIASEKKDKAQLLAENKMHLEAGFLYLDIAALENMAGLARPRRKPSDTEISALDQFVLADQEDFIVNYMKTRYPQWNPTVPQGRLYPRGKTASLNLERNMKEERRTNI